MELKEAIDLLNFRDKIFYSENEFTENDEIAKLYLKSIDSAQKEISNVSDNEKQKEFCPHEYMKREGEIHECFKCGEIKITYTK